MLDQARHKVEDTVRKLAENPNFDVLDAPKLAVDLLRLGKEQAERARSMVDKSIRQRLTTMGLATRDEVDALKRRISELEAAAHASGPAEPPATLHVAPPGRSSRTPGRAPTRGRAKAPLGTSETPPNGTP